MECVNMSTSYTKALLKPLNKAATSQKLMATSLDLWQKVAVTQAMIGNLDMPLDVLGKPMRLVKDSEGKAKFRKDGKPQTRAEKQFMGFVRTVRANQDAMLNEESDAIIQTAGEKFGAFANTCKVAGDKVAIAEAQVIQVTLNLRAAEAIALKAVEAAAIAAAKDALPIESEPVPA